MSKKKIKAVEEPQPNQVDKNKQGETKMKRIYKINWETVKTIIITMLVTAIAAFILGMVYQQSQNERVKAEAATIVKTVQVEVKEESKQ